LITTPFPTWHNEIPWDGAFEMPLQRGEFQRYDFNRMVVEFTMLNQVVPCAISTAAMDDLAGRRDAMPEREPTRLLTMPSQPSLQACLNISVPSRAEGTDTAVLGAIGRSHRATVAR
jgi:hypothetical protein